MRQAGRYQARYRALREKYTLMEIVRQPELSAMVTLWPVEELGVDGAILFSDIVVPLSSMGIGVDLREVGHGLSGQRVIDSSPGAPMVARAFEVLASMIASVSTPKKPSSASRSRPQQPKPPASASRRRDQARYRNRWN